ncbi:hypothetical protein ACP70R_035939 [Stipagrostis hirtigluma subsp. patula]
MYQEYKKRENPEAHFVQASVDAVTGAPAPVIGTVSEPALPTAALAMDDMEVDATGIASTSTGVQANDDGFDADEDDLLEDME